jgi:hypothetical protein
MEVDTFFKWVLVRNFAYHVLDVHLLLINLLLQSYRVSNYISFCFVKCNI